jgi:hypothetical protein
MRSMLAKLSLFIPILAGMMLANWYVDPGHLFHRSRGNIEQEILSIFQSGKNIEVFNVNFNARWLQRLHVEQLAAPPDILVLGSSRSMQVNSSLFPNRSFFNASVPGAMLQDYIAIYQMYYEKQLIPGGLIIEISPWILNANHAEGQWRSLINEYNRALERLQFTSGGRYSFAWPQRLRRSVEIFSPNYFQQSLKLLVMRKAKRREILNATDKAVGRHTILFPDGSREHDAGRRKNPAENVRRMAELYVKNAHVYDLRRFHEIDSYYSQLLECFIDDLQSQGIEVVLFLPAYHPAAYEPLMADARYQIIGEVETYIRKIATERGIRVCGSYNPAEYGFEETDFVDSMHTIRDALVKAFDTTCWSAK